MIASHTQLPHESFQLCEGFLDRVEVWRIGRQKDQEHTCFIAHVLNASGMVGGCIVHNQHRLWLWPLSTEWQELLDEVLEQAAVRSSSEYLGYDYSVLAVSR